MARKREPNKVHTSPERSGEQNMGKIKMEADDTNIMGALMSIREEGKKNKQAYKGLWTSEALVEAVDNYFKYCNTNDFKPTVPSLCVWLGIGKSQFYEWRTNKAKYGDKSEIIGEAMMIMESYLQGRVDKYPTGSIFLLKTTHGHIETSKLDVTSDGQKVGTSAEDVKDAISKLGLDKK